MQLNKNIFNIHQPPVLQSGIGVKIAMPYNREGSPDRHGNSEEMLRETKYE
jgi:hypothetical protein